MHRHPRCSAEEGPVAFIHLVCHALDDVLPAALLAGGRHWEDLPSRLGLDAFLVMVTAQIRTRARSITFRRQDAR